MSVQLLLADTPSCGFEMNVGHEIIPLVAGPEAEKSIGLTYYFTQQELKQLLETERLTELAIEQLQQGQVMQ